MNNLHKLLDRLISLTDYRCLTHAEMRTVRPSTRDPFDPGIDFLLRENMVHTHGTKDLTLTRIRELAQLAYGKKLHPYKWNSSKRLNLSIDLADSLITEKLSEVTI